MTGEDNAKYLEFASNISFYEFIQEEFKDRSFDTSNYITEIEILEDKNQWNAKELSQFLIENPKSFEIFEEVFQLIRFTNTQLIHFLFDIKILNGIEKQDMLLYLKNNLKFDKLFQKQYLKESNKSDSQISFNNVEHAIFFIDNKRDKESVGYAIFLFKCTVFSYVQQAIKNVKIIHMRLSNPHFTDVADRIAEYLIMNLRLNNILKCYSIKEFLENKMIPCDTKSIHGNFGKIKISEILDKHGFINADLHFNRSKINTIGDDVLQSLSVQDLKGKYAYVTEKYVKGINKKKDDKLKKFDFILLYDLKPKILIETNFYSTSGTKIGINQNEYIDLNEVIINDHRKFTFFWITDGNYWLTTDGKNRMINLYKYFEDNVLNYNLLDQRLEQLKKRMVNV